MLSFWDTFELKPPSELESYESFYMSSSPPTVPYVSHKFTVIWILEKWYIIAKNLNSTFRPEYDSIKDQSFILKLITCDKIILNK